MGRTWTKFLCCLLAFASKVGDEFPNLASEGVTSAVVMSDFWVTVEKVMRIDRLGDGMSSVTCRYQCPDKRFDHCSRGFLA